MLCPNLTGGGAGRNNSRTPEAQLEEASGLSAAIGLKIAEGKIYNVARPKPSTLFGQGVVDEINHILKLYKADHTPIAVIIVDSSLTPVQQRNLEKHWDCKVIDRTGLILEIFGERARTKEGRLQVELAALTYQRSRLVRSWTHLERQRGGHGVMGGPGERQIESDRRMLDDRVTRIKRKLKEVKRTRDLHRSARKKIPYPVVALVGYTNAGKSTLFNSMTKADVMAEDQLFATLDPTMRRLNLPSGRAVILSDTVGFISELPHELVLAFHATLEEVQQADVILHIRDISHSDTEAQKQDVIQVLKELEVAEIEELDLIEVFNKIDQVATEEKEILSNHVARDAANNCMVSAITKEGIDNLLKIVEDKISSMHQDITVSLTYDQGRLMAWLYEKGQIFDRKDDPDTGEVVIEARLSPEDMQRFEKMKNET
ncbi:MAG: GTPase HflX [Rhodospirillales bacterium]|nr:GTPase HflX [Rhodospirillales bacterium]